MKKTLLKRSVSLAFLQLWLAGCSTLISSPYESAQDGNQSERQPAPEVSAAPSYALRGSSKPQSEPTIISDKRSTTASPIAQSTLDLVPGSVSEPLKSAAQPSSPVPPAQVAQQENRTAAEVEALRSAYERLIREMGTPAEQQRLQDLLVKEINTSSSAALEQVISSYLSQGEFDAARYWLLQAQARGQRPPAWQRLALALEDNDLEAVQSILNESDSGLTQTDRLQALQRLELDSQALALAHELLESDYTLSEANELRQQADALALKLSDRISLGSELWSFGSLDVTTALALLDFRLENARVGLKIARNELDSDPDDLSVKGFDKELDISLRGEKSWRAEQIEVLAGTNRREDDSLIYGEFNWGHQFNRSVLGRLQLALNKISNETPALRAVGAKDQLSLSLLANLTPWEFARTLLKIQRYHTRDSDELAQGYGVEAALERFLLKKSPVWLVRVQGSWEDNDLEANLPAGLSPAILPLSADVETIVPDKYGSFGVGTTVQYGSSGQESVRSLQGLIDAWVGWVWPANEPGYNTRLGVGMSLFKKDLLSLDAFYANTQGGRTDEAYKGIIISYLYRF